MGFPIRKCPDQSLFAAPRTLSQRTTSFIASQRQGIHRILLRHLIVLINNARRSAAAPPKSPSRMIQAKTALSQKDQNLLAERARTSPRSGRSAAHNQTSRPWSARGPSGWATRVSNTFSLNDDSEPAHPREPGPQTSMSSTLNQRMNHEPTRGKNSTGTSRQTLQIDPRSNWWSQTGSNRRPHACKARALPTELWPR